MDECKAELLSLTRSCSRYLLYLLDEGIEAVSVNPETNPISKESKPTILDAAHALEHLRLTIGDCRRCKLHRSRSNLVFGEGSVEPDLVLVGEGPGFDEDRQGRPFVGAAGQLLNKIIKAMGLAREQIYICNIVKCHPPKNRDPEQDEIEICGHFLIEQL
ncbi:MAG: uracil-DNA glycosylase, partial [bacterium]